MLVWTVTLLSPALAIDDIKKINSMDVENLRADRTRLVLMEGHGSVIQYLPGIETPFYKQRQRPTTQEKIYPEPWRQVRPKTIAPRTSSNTTAITTTKKVTQEKRDENSKTGVSFEEMVIQTLPEKEY